LLITVICFALLTAQSSYRFYQWANARPVRTNAAALRAQIVGGPGSQHGPTAGSAFHSLDKRFDIAPFFLLPVPVAAPPPIVTDIPAAGIGQDTGLFDRSLAAMHLRGPPAFTC